MISYVIGYGEGRPVNELTAENLARCTEDRCQENAYIVALDTYAIDDISVFVFCYDCYLHDIENSPGWWAKEIDRAFLYEAEYPS